MENQARPGLRARLLDITHEAVIACDGDERIVYWNHGAETTYGWTEGEVLGKAADELLRPTGREGAGDDPVERLEVLRRGETLSGGFRAQCKDGGAIDIEYNARGFFDADQRLEGYVAVHRDVTARRRAERAMREREIRLQALIDASPLGIAVMDTEGNPVFYNPKCAELHGIGMGKAFGAGWAQALHPDDRDRVTASWYAAARAGTPWADTYRFVHRDGRVVWVSGRAAPMHVDGRLLGFVGTLEDISAEREAREKAERATRMRDLVLATVTHDLRNPLNTIALTLQALFADEVTRRQYARELKMIERAAATMNRLVGDLLNVARHEAGYVRLESETIDLDALCREAIEVFEAEARERGIELTCRIDTGLSFLEGDPHRLRQVLSNLLGNALRFTPPQGRVLVRGERAGDGVRLSVEDTGPGVREEDLPCLFEPFWQGDQADGSGSGLGLSICRAIVEAHGGRIWAESRPGKGTAIRFTLP